MNLTYHGTPKAYFDSLDLGRPYIPPDFDGEGFIHCTDGREAVSIVLTLHYRDQPGDWLVLYVEKDRVRVPVRYDDPAAVFPHICGPLNRDAIVAVRPIRREPDGAFLMPEPL